MIPIQSFDPTIATSGIIHTNGVNLHQQLMMYNDSPCGLMLTFADNNRAIIPAFWNKDFIVEDVAMGDVKWSIYYTLSNPSQYPISICYGEVNEKQERKASANFPINRGIVVTGGTVTSTTSGTTSLVNDGNAAGSPFIESTILGQTVSSVNITNDGIAFVREMIAGVLTQVLHLQNVDPIIVLGAATHTCEILGILQVDGVTNLTGVLTLTNGVNVGIIRDNVNGHPVLDLSAGDGSIKIAAIALLTHILGGLTVDQATTITGILTAPGANVLGAIGVLTHILGTLTVDGNTTHTGTTTLTGTTTANGDLVATANLKTTAKKIIDMTSGNNLVDWSNSGTYLFGNPAIHGLLTYRGDGVNTDWRYFGRSAFSGTGSVTANHGLKYLGAALTPQSIQAMQGINSAGSQNMGCNTTGATQTNIVSGAGAAWTAIASAS